MYVRLTRRRGKAMEYEACYMSSLQFTTIILYKTVGDYNTEKPAVIYIVTPRRKKKLAIDKARLYERVYKGVEVRILFEGKDKDKIDKILDKCLESKLILHPSIW